MKLSIKEKKVKNNALVLCCDVGKKSINAFGAKERGDEVMELEDVFENKTFGIRSKLEEIMEIAREEFGADHLHVICEPTGGFERQLLKIARSLGCTTAYVSGEATSKLKTTVGNDPEKSDEKDPRIIDAARKSGAVLTHRVLPEAYRTLRLLGEFLDDESQKMVDLRNQISALLVQLWPDYGQRPDFLYGKAGEALVDLYGCDPVLIEGNGWDRFRREMLAHARFHDKTLKTVWAEAVASTLHLSGADERRCLSDRIKDLYSDWRKHARRKEDLKRRFVDRYKSLKEYEKLCEVPVSDYQMAKLIAETGPLTDFRYANQLLRYAGLNLCRNASGSWAGQTKISKKGRTLLRKILYQIAFSTLVTKRGIYAKFYEKKKEELKIGMKAMVCVMRKFLNVIHGVAKSSIPFDLARVQLCESEYAKAA